MQKTNGHREHYTNEQSLREKKLHEQVTHLRAESRNAEENAEIMREALQVTTDCQFNCLIDSSVVLWKREYGP